MESFRPRRLVPADIAIARLSFRAVCWLTTVAIGLFAPCVAISQSPYTCQTDHISEVCTYPPTIQYGVFAPTGSFFGNSRDEACLRYAASVPNPNRRSYLGIGLAAGFLFHCVFEFEFPNSPGQLFPGFDGDNRELKVCPVNSVMYNAAGQYWHDNWTRPGALYMTWPPGTPMPDSSTLYPSSVMSIAFTGAHETAMCASRGAPIPVRNHGEPNGQSDGSSCSAWAGNPINIGIGLKTQTEIDYARTGKLRFIRTYNSGTGTNYFGGPLGKGWQHNYGVRLAIANVVTAFRGDGRIVEFVPNGSAWLHWLDVNDRLVELRDTSGVRTGWKYLSSAHDVELYDASGTLLSITSSTGATTTLTYSDGTASGGRGGVIEGTATPLPRSLLLRVTDSFGVSLSFGYNADYRLVRVTRPDGNSHRYSYGSASNLASVIYPDERSNKARTYVYESASFVNALTGTIDEKAERHSTYDYDQFGRAISTELALNANRYGLTFNSNGTTTVTDPLSSTRTYGFNNMFGLVRVASQSQPAGSGCGPSSSAITYDTRGNIASRVDFNNNKICYAYDLSRNLETKRVEGLAGSAVCSTALSSPPTGARIINTQWHPDWRLETRIAEPKKLTTITYNGQGATCAPSTVLVDGKPPAVICTRTEQATTDPTGAAGFAATVTGTARTWRYTYTTYGRVLTATDPNSRTTTTSYHPDNDADLGKRGNVASITNAANHITYLTDYNPHGQPTRIVDPNGVVTVLTYDPRMRLTSRTVGNEATVFGYDPVGQMTSVNLPDGARLTYTYDAAHRLTAINDHKGNRIDYTLDAMGNRTAEQMKDPGGVLVGNIARVIDALNRVQQVTGSVQ